MRSASSDRSRLAVVVLLLSGAPAIHASQGTHDEARSWTKVMYLGGVAGVRGKSLEWDNTLTISAEKITFAGKNRKDGIAFEIDTKAVRRLDYTGHRHVNDGASGIGMTAGLLGALGASAARSTDHYLEVTYALPDGSVGGFLLRLHKDNQQQIIDAIHAATGIEK
jgi:hypothetical protein